MRAPIGNNQGGFSYRIGPKKQSRRLIDKVQQPWPKDTPIVSVIVPCFNYGDVINRALDSIFAQSFQNFEIIVIEGGSTDNSSADIVRQIKREKTRVFVRKRKHLPGNNRNFGIKRAQGKYVCCLDPDDILHPMFLERALFLAECADYDIVSTSYRYFGERKEEVLLPSRPTFVQISGGASSPSMALFKKTTWYRIGGYCDTGLGADHIPEDWDFYVRAAGMGARICNLQDSLLQVNWHQNSLSRHSHNLAYNLQCQILRKRHQKILQFKNFEKFNRNRETLVRVASGTRNLIQVRPHCTAKKSGSLIMPPVSFDSLDINLHLDLIGKLASEDIVILTLGPAAQLPPRLIDVYKDYTQHIFNLADVADDPQLKSTLMDYLIESRHIRTVIVGSSLFDIGDLAQLASLYDCNYLEKTPL